MENIGLVGVGLMGHGIASNIVKHGHPLSVLEHPGNQPLDALKAAGVTTFATASELAAAVDVVILCVTGTPQVEANVYGKDGILEGCRKGQVVIDCSTAMPESSDRIRADFEKKGVRFVDAPLARTPQHAEEGKLNCMVGADAATFAEVRPVLEKFCENIVHAGGPGAGHKVKLVYNFLAMGSAALICESLAACAKTGLDLGMFHQLVSAGGANSNMFQMLVPKAMQGDLTGLLFTLGNAKKDIGYYQQFTAAAQLAEPMGAALMQTLVQAGALGLGDKYIASLIEAHEKINGMQVVKH